MRRRLTFLLSLLVLSIGLVSAQVSKVTGVVVSAEDGEPVIGASVLVVGTNLGTITDIDGKYEIANVPADVKNFLCGNGNTTSKHQAGDDTHRIT